VYILRRCICAILYKYIYAIGLLFLELDEGILIVIALRKLASIPAPATASSAAPQRRAEGPKPVTAEEIVAALPPEGISISALLKLFPGRVIDKKDRERFIRIVKDNSSYSQDDKLLRPKA
jgi:hypothetical protein